MRQLITSEPFLIFITIACYYIGCKINNRFHKAITNPMLIAIVLLIATLSILDIDYETYEQGSHIISLLLGPTVVALGYLLHKQIKYIRGNEKAILTAIGVGSVVGVLSVVGICMLFGCPEEIWLSMEPKSVTMPIALGISGRSGGLLALTAVVVFVCGVFGSIIGPWLLRKVGVKSRVAQGLAMGAAAHGVGTGEAMKMGQLEGAVAGMAIGLMGVATAIVVPIVEIFIK